MNKELLHNKVVREIIAIIASGVCEDGQRLPSERELCEQFGVSRGTVRQGLADLEQVGIVKIKRGSGVYAQKFSHKKLPSHLLPREFKNVSLEDIITARKVIESATIELACDNITKKQIGILEQMVNEMAEAKDNLPEFLRLDMNFHQMVVQSAGNVALVTAFEAISEYLKYSQVFSTLRQGQEQVAISHHLEMLEALKKKDKKTASKAMVTHLEYTKKTGVETVGARCKSGSDRK